MLITCKCLSCQNKFSFGKNQLMMINKLFCPICTKQTLIEISPYSDQLKLFELKAGGLNLIFTYTNKINIIKENLNNKKQLKSLKLGDPDKLNIKFEFDNPNFTGFPLANIAISYNNSEPYRNDRFRKIDLSLLWDYYNQLLNQNITPTITIGFVQTVKERYNEFQKAINEYNALPDEFKLLLELKGE